MHRDEVFQTLRSHLGDFREFGVARLAVFGSVARGEASGTSDIDILVRFEPGEKSFGHFMGLRCSLEDLFPERKIDLVREDALKDAIREQVLAEAADVA